MPTPPATTYQSMRIPNRVARPCGTLLWLTAALLAVPASAAAGNETAGVPAPDAPRSITPKEQDTMTTTINRAAAYAVHHDPTWTVRVEGPSVLLKPTAVPVDSNDPEFYAFSAAPWPSRGSLDEVEYAEEAARQLLADAPAMRPDGPVERLGNGVALVRCSAWVEGRTIRMVVLGRAIDAQVIGLVLVGTDATIRGREDVARRLFASLAKVEPAQLSAAGLSAEDQVFVGAWSTDDVMTSGGGFDFGGSASMVTQRILELNPDGTFRYGSRAAGGGPGVTFEAGFSVQQAGSWTVDRGSGGTYLVLFAGGGSERVRCVPYQGQLVLGESGARKFYSRLR